MEVERLKRLARQILADALSVGSTATGGPTVSAAEEADVLDAIELRLRALLERYAHESDEQVAGRFREAHPDLFRDRPAPGNDPASEDQ